MKAPRHFAPMFAVALALFSTAPLAEPTAAPAPATEPAAPTPAPVETAAVPALPEVMVTVNGEAIPQRHADILKGQLVSGGQPDSKALDKRVLDTLVNLEVISQAAKREGLDKSQEVQDKVAMQYKDLLAKAYLDHYVATHPISDDMMAAEYAKLRAELPEKEYKTRHMLIKSEAEAKKLIARLKKEKFDTLAKANSKDEGSAKKGGDLGWVAPDAVVKPFADAMVALKKGETTAKPVQSDFGWHIIRVEDVRALDVPPLEAVKPQLRKELSQRMIARAVSDLRTQAKIE